MVLPNDLQAADPKPIVTTIAGTGLRGFEDGPGIRAMFSDPKAVAIDASGDIYVADTGNNAIRKIDSSGNVTTLAGDGSRGFTDGTSEATFNAPNALTVDRSGNVFVSDAGNYAVRKITADGTVSTVAGNGGSTRKTENGYSFIEPGKDGTGTRSGTATFATLKAITTDNAGNLYIADYHAIRRIDSEGNVSTFLRLDSFYQPTGLAVDNVGNVYVVDPQFGVWRFDGLKNTTGFLRFPFSSGNEPPSKHVAVDATGTIVLSDSGTHTIDQIDRNQTVTRIAGNPMPGFADGPGSANGTATFRAPAGITFGSDGTMIVADSGNNSIRKIKDLQLVGAPTPPTTTLKPILLNQPARKAKPTRISTIGSFDRSNGIAVDTRGNIYVSDTLYSRVLLLPPSGPASVVAKRANELGTTEQFYPSKLTVDPEGALYISDVGNFAIRKIDKTGKHSIVAGNKTRGFVDGPGGPDGIASFVGLSGLAIDRDRNVYVADPGSNAIRKIDRSLNVTTLAGNGTPGFSNGTGGRNGTGTLSGPGGVAINPVTGSLFVTESQNHSVRKIDRNGTVSTFAGNGTRGNSNGNGASATFADPSDLAFDARGDLYVVDSGNLAIRKIDAAGNVTTAFQWPDAGGTASPNAIAVDKAGILYVTTFGDGNSPLYRIDLTIPESKPSSAKGTRVPTPKRAKEPIKKARIVSKKIIKK
jgi:sugar lactone lactonase YvrE